MEVRFCTSIEEVDSACWENGNDSSYPFIKRSFLAALENAGDPTEAQNNEHDSSLVVHASSKFVACNATSGWQPNHAVIFDNDQPIAFIPGYTKSHSYGEYIFDWAWANAYERNGFNYYPKLLNAIPFTPVSGPRLLAQAGVKQANLLALIAAYYKSACEEGRFSSFHSLYLPEQHADVLNESGFLKRHSFQYHWFNKNPATDTPYRSFEDYLQQLKSRKRKSVKKERRVVADEKIELVWVDGANISEEQWDCFYLFYQLTYARRSGHGGYLPKAFFKAIGRDMPESILLLLARKKGNTDEYIAGSLYFKSNDTLYGRYWGCTEQAEFLHFEACIYQGIEYCIEHGLKKFDAGAQGEHKLHRGFVPVSTWSSHWIRDERFREAIARFIEDETRHNIAYMKGAANYLPYKIIQI